DPPRELEVHLSIFFIELRQSGRSELLADPAVGQNHQEAAHNTEVAEEEVEVEDQTIAECLGDHYAEEASDSVFTIFAHDDEGGADTHSHNVNEKEEVSKAPWY
ncbi:MAG: hypothetical protein Q9214_007255, partial [Letrouitia sp. 1 TL-2023]